MKYCIIVTRIMYQSVEVEIEASNENEAIEIACDNAENYMYDGDNGQCDYEAMPSGDNA